MGPAPVVAAARTLLRDIFPPGSHLLLGLSGGTDSLALADTLAFEAPKNGWILHSLTVDHRIRAGSDREAEEVAHWASTHGFDAHIHCLETLDPALGPEGAARAGRYAALAELAREIGAVVVTAHTMSDQAETVILGLSRGSGPRSVAGMAVQAQVPGNPDVSLVRPFLSMSRRDTVAICRARDLHPLEDPTNSLQSPWTTASGQPLMRARIRHEVLPMLADVVNPSIEEALAKTAELVREDVEALDALAQQMYREWVGERTTASLRHHPAAVRTRIIRAWLLAETGVSPQYSHLRAVDALVMGSDNNRALDVPGGIVRRDANRLELQRRLTPPVSV